MNDLLLANLQSFGLTQYEAKAYVALLSAGPSNAYKVSKISGIPRARIYDILESLAVRGLVMLEEANDGTKTYISLPASVFLEQAREKWLAAYNLLEKDLKEIETRENKRDIYVSTVRGERNILAFCRVLIRRAKQQVTLALWNPMYTELLSDLEECLRRECRIRGITFAVENPLTGLDGHRMNEFVESLAAEKWFILSVDSRELLYGHSAERNGNAFYTDDPVHIYLLEDYIWHDVLVSRLIKKEKQDQFDAWILPETEKFFGRKLVPESFWKRIGKLNDLHT